MTVKTTNGATSAAGEASELQPPYARAGEVQRLTGLKRSTLYRLLNAGSIKGAVLPVTGRKSGVRVFDMASIFEFIKQHQKGTNPHG